MGLRVLAVACVWIVLGLVVAEPALGAPQSRDSEKKQDSEKRDSEKQETEKPTSGDAGTAGKRADARQAARTIPVLPTLSHWELHTCALQI